MFSVAVLLLFTAGSWVECEQLTQPSLMNIQPGQSLTIPCQVSYSVDSYYTAWIRQPAAGTLEWIGMKYSSTSYYKDSLKNQFSIDLKSSSKTATLTGQNMQPGDSAVYYCARGKIQGYGRIYFDYWGQGTKVTVSSAALVAPTVFPLLPCGSDTGDMVTLSCLARDFTPSTLAFEWTKEGTVISDFLQYPSVETNSVFTAVSQVQVSRQDWDSKAQFHCKAVHSGGDGDGPTSFQKVEQETYSKLPTLKLLASSHEAFFVCFANDFSPKTFEFNWLKDDNEIISSISEITTAPTERDTAEGKVYSAASFLKVNDTERSDNAKFTCEFKGKSATGDQYVNASLTHATIADETDCPEREQRDLYINIIPPNLEDLFIDKKGSLTCEVHVKTPGVTSISWKNVAASTMIPGEDKTGKITLLMDITLDEWIEGIHQTCVVQHSQLPEVTKEYKRMAEKAIRPAIFMLPPVKQSLKGMVTLTCFVKDFFPQDLVVTWQVDDVKAEPMYYRSSTTKPVLNNDLYSAYSQLSFSVDQWDTSGIQFSCTVYHESVVNTNKAISRSIVSKSHEQVNMVNLNMDLPDECKSQ